MSKAYDLKVLYEELDLDGVQDEVKYWLGEDEADDLLHAIANLDFELRQAINREHRKELRGE